MEKYITLKLTEDNVDSYASKLFQLRAGGRIFGLCDSKKIQEAKKSAYEGQELLKNLILANDGEKKYLCEQLLKRIEELEDQDVVCFLQKNVGVKFMTLESAKQKLQSMHDIIDKLESKSSNGIFMIGYDVTNKLETELIKTKRNVLFIDPNASNDKNIIATAQSIKLGLMKDVTTETNSDKSNSLENRKVKFLWDKEFDQFNRERTLRPLTGWLDLIEEMKDEFVISYDKWLILNACLATVYQIELIDPLDSKSSLSFSDGFCPVMAYKNIKFIVN